MSTTEQTQQTQGLPSGTWGLDPVHSEIGFSVDYMAGTFRGTFSNFEARLDGGAIEGSAEVPSVHVKDANLEAHLQGPDFFDAERNPRLTFTSQNVRRTGDEVMIAGEITIKGETQPLNLKGTLKDPITDPFGNERFGLKLEGVLDRTQFGIKWNNPLPSGDAALADEVSLNAELQLVKAG